MAIDVNTSSHKEKASNKTNWLALQFKIMWNLVDLRYGLRRRVVSRDTGELLYVEDGKKEGNATALFGLFGEKKAQRVLRCRDAGQACDAVITGATDEEVLQKAAAHAATVHKMQATPEMAAQLKRLIKSAREYSEKLMKGR